jgi:hypothetical protein
LQQTAGKNSKFIRLILIVYFEIKDKIFLMKSINPDDFKVIDKDGQKSTNLHFNALVMTPRREMDRLRLTADVMYALIDMAICLRNGWQEDSLIREVLRNSIRDEVI